MNFVMPERRQTDMAVHVYRRGDGFLELSHGDGPSLVLSPFNAVRMFGVLALFLGIQLPKALLNRIKL